MTPDPKFKTGAKPTPRHKLLSVEPHKVFRSFPPQFAFIPKQLDMWGNDQYGDCVTAEEAFAKACYSPEIFVSASTVEAWASAGGFLDGANLPPVMDAMAKAGFPGTGSQLYNDGPYTGVDYSNETVLQSALSLGPVKIGIDSSALPSGAGNQQGWSAVGGSPGQYTNEDHCVALCGYGPTAWLYQQLGVPQPAGLPAAGYLLYTWSTIGFVDHAWIMSTVGEAWLRNPTTVGVPPLPGPTPPVPPTPPIPPVPPVPPPTPPAPGVLPPGSYTLAGVYNFSTQAGPAPLSKQELTDMVNYLQSLLAQMK
jgi:hypothetical protein